jgi:preprotein translocase subunit SecD
MRAVFCLLGLLLLFTWPARAGKSPPKIALSIHIQTTGDGLSAMQAQTVYLPPNLEPIQIRTIPEVTDRNLISVDPQSGGTLLTFDHEGQINLSAVTAQNQGRILVVLLNGYIIYAPVVDEQISSGQLLLPHPLAPQVVQLLQEAAKKNVHDNRRA